MRLLKLRSNGIIELTGEYTNVNIPRYAILSHTWGRENQEVTFQDITSGGGLHKDCYQKLEFCAQQAAADGIRYFWVDTCCIDKTNSVVYNEAINSMYRWYKSADKCYVYMVDVRGNSRRWKSAFRDSRWFTRGWTLQELIAPKSVTFYGCDGVRLGSKTGSLEGLIHDITGIHKDALQGAPMDNFTVQERFSWFGDRQTKKEEDMIYSQLGIFGVYMEMIYGEGYDGAKQRLQERIERREIQRRKQIEGTRAQSWTSPHDVVQVSSPTPSSTRSSRCSNCPGQLTWVPLKDMNWIVSLRCEVCNWYQAAKMAGLKYITSDGRSLDERFVLDRFHYHQGPPLREASLYRCFVCDKILSTKDGFFSNETAQTKLSKHVKEHSYAELVGSSNYAPRPPPKNYNANPGISDILMGLF